MFHAWRVLVGALVAATGFLVLYAQTPAQVLLTVEPATLIAGRSAILNVRVQIPRGHFVPAETRGSLKGAWLKSLSSSLWFSQRLPTYPVPDSVRLPGADTPVLVYSGEAIIRLPVEVAAGTERRADVSVRFGYQLCDSKACSDVAVATTQTKLNIEEPSPNQYLLAYRVDSQRVVIVTETSNPVSGDHTDLIRPLARFVPQIAILPPRHEARSRFVGDFGMGVPWTIASNAGQYTAVAEQPAITEWRCGGGDEMRLALMARVRDRTFVDERAKYFLASRAPRAPNQRLTPLQLRLDESQRRELEGVIDRQMRITVPSLFAPDPYSRDPAAQPSETAYDRRVREGRARLKYHVEAFRLAPDANPRLYVRAYWTVGLRAQTGLILWIRFDGEHFSVEQTDASASSLARYLELKDLGPSAAAHADHAGMLLNVVPAAEGWAYLITGRRGYENVDVSVWKYSSVGPHDAGIRYRYGC